MKKRSSKTHPLPERLQALIEAIYRDDCFCAPDNWDVDEMCHLLQQAANGLRKLEQQS